MLWLSPTLLLYRLSGATGGAGLNEERPPMSGGLRVAWFLALDRCGARRPLPFR